MDIRTISSKVLALQKFLECATALKPKLSNNSFTWHRTGTTTMWLLISSGYSASQSFGHSCSPTVILNSALRKPQVNTWRKRPGLLSGEHMGRERKDHCLPCREMSSHPQSCHAPSSLLWLTLKFSTMRCCVMDLGITITFLWMWNRMRTWKRIITASERGWLLLHGKQSHGLAVTYCKRYNSVELTLESCFSNCSWILHSTFWSACRGMVEHHRVSFPLFPCN